MGAKDKDVGVRSWPDDPDIHPSSNNDTGSSAAVPLVSEPSIHGHSASTGPNPAGTCQQSQSLLQPKSFEFVLVNDNESRRQVRRHAMRQYVHQRRLDSIVRLGARVPVAGWATRPIPDSSCMQVPVEWVDETPNEVSLKGEKRSSSPDEELHTREKGKGSFRVALPNSPIKPQKAKRKDTSLSLVPKHQYSDPQVTPEPSAVRDPFSSYPVPVTNADHELIQHFIVTYPSMMYKFVGSPANILNPMKEIFHQLALHDDLPFQAMLAIASRHRAGVDGKTESVQSLTHKMRALRLMNKRIHMESEAQQDGTIYAAATMAVIEKWSRDAPTERMHFTGLASMIRNRGGMQAMRTSSPFLEKVLYWVDFSSAPNAIVGTALPWAGAQPDTPPTGFDFLNPDMHLPIPHNSTAAESTENLCEQYRACEDFLRFFRNLQQLECTALNSPSTLESANTPPRRKSFIPGTKLHSVLTNLPDYDHGIRDIRFIDEYTCMSCLFFLAVALYHSYSTISHFDPYLHWLETEVDSLNSYGNTSITSILWLFLQNGGFSLGDKQSDDSGARCWVVSRMVRIAKHLEWKRQGTIWDSLRQVLIDFVATQQMCALGSESVDAEALAARARRRDASQSGEPLWNEDIMRREILDFDIPTLFQLGTFSRVENVNVPILT